MTAPNWRNIAPAVVLDAFPSLTVNMVGHVLFPDRSEAQRRRAVRELIRSGALDLIDTEQPLHRWHITSDEVRRYLKSGPARRTA